jgi:hypothetical protein
MKAITIIQPWATLIALGEKRFETRSWATKHRGLLAIHAGKKVDKEACLREPIRSVLDKHGYSADNLPTGAIVATSNLRNCFSVHIDHSGDVVLLTSNESPVFWMGNDTNEQKFGWYEEGRFAWELADINPIGLPILAKGQQGLWNYPMDGG